jgi:hypothetical protein
MNFEYIIVKIRQYPYATGLAVLSIALAAILFFRSPLVAQLQEEVNDKQSEWDRIERNIRNSRELQAHVSLIEAHRNNLDGRLMSREEVAINYNYFYRLEELSGVSIVSLSQNPPFAGQAPANVPRLEDFDVIGYTISVEGSYQNVIKFMRLIDTGKHLTRMETLNLSRAGREGGGQTVSASIQLFALGKKR